VVPAEVVMSEVEQDERGWQLLLQRVVSEQALVEAARGTLTLLLTTADGKQLDGEKQTQLC
jgi:hypothetical protein